MKIVEPKPKFRRMENGKTKFSEVWISLAQPFTAGIKDVNVRDKYAYEPSHPGRLRPFSLNQYFCFDWRKGVNALGDWVSGFFLIPGLKPWATESWATEPWAMKP